MALNTFQSGHQYFIQLVQMKSRPPNRWMMYTVRRTHIFRTAEYFWQQLNFNTLIWHIRMRLAFCCWRLSLTFHFLTARSTDSRSKWAFYVTFSVSNISTWPETIFLRRKISFFSLNKWVWLLLKIELVGHLLPMKFETL